MQLGLVNYVAETPKGYYGFLITAEGSVYFKQNDYQPFCVDIDLDIVTLYGEGDPVPKPNIDDILYFMPKMDPSGRLNADAWCLKEEGERIEGIITSPKKFSVVKTRLAMSGKQVSTIWTGYDIVLMHYETRLKSPIESNNGYDNGVYTSYGIQYEDISN